MVKKIPIVFIRNLLEHINIVDLINTKLKLKKIGKNFYTFCPFHREKNPSFTVNNEKQFFYCFGCGIHGNAIDFLMNYEKLEFTESIEELAYLFGLEVPYEKNMQLYQFQNKNLYQLMYEISIFYQKMLKKSVALYATEYLKNRGLNKDIISYFSIGFSPTNSTSVISKFGKSEKELIVLKNSGILIKNKKGEFFDRFKGRIIFPIKDKRGRIIAFGGRSIYNNKPKYLNSPDTNIFKKGSQLYGLYEAKKNNIKLSKLLIVEGYMDVLSLFQFGINYSVSSLGTSTTTCQIGLLYRITDQIICCYDGDASGRNAAWKTLKKALPYLTDGKQLQFIFLPKDEDPDTFIRKIGKKKFEEYISNAIPLSTFLFEKLMVGVDISNLDGKAKFSSLILPLLKKIPGETLRFFLREKLSKKLGILDNSNFDFFLPSILKKSNNLLQIKFKKTKIRILIALLIQNPKLSSFFPKIKKLKELTIPGISLFFELMEICYLNPKITTAQLLENYRNSKFYFQIKFLAIWDHMIKDEVIDIFFFDYLMNLHHSLIEKRQEKIISIDRMYGTTLKERKEFWSLTKKLLKN